jgi:hypothetical protein
VRIVGCDIEEIGEHDSKCGRDKHGRTIDDWRRVARYALMRGGHRNAMVSNTRVRSCLVHADQAD